MVFCAEKRDPCTRDAARPSKTKSAARVYFTLSIFNIHK